jgi:hypothetical protein
MSSQTCFTTGNFQPIRSSWRQLLETHDQRIFLSTEPLQHYSLCTILSNEKMGSYLINVPGIPSNIHFAHKACYWKFFLLHFTQVLCQVCRVDHVQPLGLAWSPFITLCKPRRNRLIKEFCSWCLRTHGHGTASNSTVTISAVTGMCLAKALVSNGRSLWLQYLGYQASCHNI